VRPDETQAAEVTAALGMEPRLLRLISAMHEAGHAIVGATVGFEVTEARAETVEAIGSNEVTVGFGPGRDVPLSDLLSWKAAGYQASFTWLQGRGIDGAGAPYARPGVDSVARHVASQDPAARRR
jgi:hypothetical protein